MTFRRFDNVFSNQPMVSRFKKLPQAAKEEVFAQAAKLFEGEKVTRPLCSTHDDD